MLNVAQLHLRFFEDPIDDRLQQSGRELSKLFRAHSQDFLFFTGLCFLNSSTSSPNIK